MPRFPDVLPFSASLVALVALIPGVAAWWTGRRIALGPTDPALLEVLFAQRLRMRSVIIGAASAILVLAGRHAFWGIPVMAVCATAGSYSLRRRLGIDTASFPNQLWRNAKSLVGGLGFWIAMAFVPEIVLGIDPRYRALSLLLIPLLLAWEHWYPRIWLRLHDAEPLTGDALTSQIATIVERAGIAAPSVYRVGGRHARFMNALALPSVRHPAIGLGNALVELLEPDEVAAIYAHELSHIEQYSPRKIRRIQTINRVLIILGVVVPLVLAQFAPAAAAWVPWVWPLALIAALIQRGKASKDRETESDLRAAALCGDPEVVIRALIKIHVHGFIPRRWAVDFERQASHPSLTRRIQALRGEAAHALATLDAPVVLSTARDGSVVVFDNARAYWFDGVPAGIPNALESLRMHAASIRSVLWAELVELRVVTLADNRALKATHRNGDSWSVPLEPGHIEAMQKALDVMDVRLHRELGKRPLLDTRLVAAVMIIAILWSSELSVLLVPALIAAFKPSTAIIGALGTMSLASGLFGSLREWSLSQSVALRPIVLAVLGALALWITWHRVRREGKRDGLRLTLLAMGGLSAITGVIGAMMATDMPIREIATQSIVPAFALMLVGLASALALGRSRASRTAAAVAAAIAIAAISPSIATMRLLGGGDAFARTRATASEIGRVVLGTGAAGLSVSPTGDRFLVRQFEYDGDDDEEVPKKEFSYTLGDFHGSKRNFAALEAELVDDAHVLVLHRVDGALELRLETLDSIAVWTKRLPALRRPALTVSPRDRRWTIVDEDPQVDSVLVISGTPDVAEPLVRRLPSSRAGGGRRRVYNVGGHIIVGERIIVPAIDYSRQRPTSLAMFGLAMPRVDLWENTASGEQTIGRFEGIPECGVADEGRVVCIVRRLRDAGQLWIIESSGPARLVGRIPLDDAGRLFPGPGARVTGVRRDATLLTVDAVARRISAVQLGPDSGYVAEVRSAPERLIVVRYTNGKATLVLYRVRDL
jgi:Zn-dependent protease with chaperone function